MESLKNIVLLIDGDNTQLCKLGSVIREVSAYGRIVVKRAYGNWKKDNLKNWESELKRLAIKAEQQFDYVSGKNATDMALVIDAVNLLHKGIYDAFVLVSSDSDYTPLAINLHESGVYVIGVGAKITPEAFRNSCDEFIYLENIAGEGAKAGKAAHTDTPAAEKAAEKKAAADSREKIAGIDEIHDLLETAYEKYQDDDGFVTASAAGDYIRRAMPDFDVRSYGFKKLLELIKAFPDRYETRRSKAKSSGKATIVSYRCKN